MTDNDLMRTSIESFMTVTIFILPMIFSAEVFSEITGCYAAPDNTVTCNDGITGYTDENGVTYH